MVTIIIVIIIINIMVTIMAAPSHTGQKIFAQRGENILIAAMLQGEQP